VKVIIGSHSTEWIKLYSFIIATPWESERLTIKL